MKKVNRKILVALAEEMAGYLGAGYTINEVVGKLNRRAMDEVPESAIEYTVETVLDMMDAAGVTKGELA